MQAPEIWFPHLGIEIPRLSRVFVDVGGFAIYWYGVLIVIAAFTGLMLALREAKRIGQNPDLYFDFFFYVMIASFIGARLYYVIFTWNEYPYTLLNIFISRDGGLAIYGGVIAAFITAFVYTRRKRIPFGIFTDTCAPSLIFGQAIGRWGNFFNREVFGGYTDSVFAMRYLKEQVPVVPLSVAERLVTDRGAQYIQVQPTFLYESLWNLSVFLIMVIYRRHKKCDGEIILMYLFGYGVGRFFIEGIRTDQLFLMHSSIPVSQLLSAILVVVSAILWVILRVRHRKQELAGDVYQSPFAEYSGESDQNV